MKHNTYFSVAPVPVSILHLVLETIERQGWNVAHVAYCGNVQKSSIMTPQKQIFPGFVVIANRWHDGDKRPIPPVFNMEAIEKAASSGESVLPAIATPQSPADPQKPADSQQPEPDKGKILNFPDLPKKKDETPDEGRA
jgi:hypothetical protein